jgi:hypothetical protein
MAPKPKPAFNKHQSVGLPLEFHDKIRYLAYRSRRPMMDIVVELLDKPLKEAMRRDMESQLEEQAKG